MSKLEQLQDVVKDREAAVKRIEQEGSEVASLLTAAVGAGATLVDYERRLREMPKQLSLEKRALLEARIEMYEAHRAELLDAFEQGRRRVEAALQDVTEAQRELDAARDAQTHAQHLLSMNAAKLGNLRDALRKER